MSSIPSNAGTDHAFAAMLCLYKNNDASEVEAALRSAFDDQDLAPSQLIAVFDGPVPADVEEVINQIALTHDVKRVVHDVCKGHGQARSAAIEACTHDWIAIVDADDISMPNRFRDLFEIVAAYPESAVIGGGLVEFHIEQGNRVLGSEVKYPETPENVRRYLASRSPIAQPTSILRVAAIQEVGNYQDWFNNEDYHLWIRLVTAGYELRNVPQPVLWFRTNPDLFARRGGFRYWMNEVRLQTFSLRSGTTTFGRLLFGATVRFIVQVVMPNRAREFFYKRILRKL